MRFLRSFSGVTLRDRIKTEKIRKKWNVEVIIGTFDFSLPIPSFPHVLLSPFLACCAILPTSIGGKGPHWRHSPFIRRSPSWGFLEFSSAVRQISGDLCTASRIISLSPLSLATDGTDATLGASGFWLGTRTGASGTTTLTESFFLTAAHDSMVNRKKMTIGGPPLFSQTAGTYSKHNTLQNAYRRILKHRHTLLVHFVV